MNAPIEPQAPEEGLATGVANEASVPEASNSHAAAKKEKASEANGRTTGTEAPMTADGHAKAGTETNASAEPQANQERILGTAPVGMLFGRYALTTLVGYLAQIVMVILEGLVIGQGLGAAGLACITVVLPLELLNLALGGALGSGTASLVGELRGSGDEQGAQKAFSQGFWLTAYLVIAVSALIWINARPVAELLGATGDLVDEVTSFVRTLMLLYPFCSLGQLLMACLRTDEKPHVASGITVASSTLSFLCLFTMVIVLKRSFASTALYFGLSTALWFSAIFYVNGSRKSGLHVSLKEMRLSPAIASTILRRGIPLFGVQAASLVYTTVINNYLGSLGGGSDLAAFSVINGYVIYLLDMACLASTMGLAPIASYNAGAHKPKRLVSLLRVSTIGTTAALACVVAIVMASAEPISAFFLGADASDAELLALTVSHFLPILIAAPLGFSAQVASAYFQAIGREGISTVLSTCRYLIFAVPLIVALSIPFGIDGVWWAQPVADVLAATLSLAFCIREAHKLRAQA